MLCLRMHSNVMHRFMVHAFQDPPLCSSTSETHQKQDRCAWGCPHSHWGNSMLLLFSHLEHLVHMKATKRGGVHIFNEETKCRYCVLTSSASSTWRPLSVAVSTFSMRKLNVFVVFSPWASSSWRLLSMAVATFSLIAVSHLECLVHMKAPKHGGVHIFN